MVDEIFFWISFSSILGIALLSLFFKVKDGAQFWPPPSKKSWQHRVFLLLFRSFFYFLVALTVVHFDSRVGIFILVSGFALASIGFGFAIYITLRMGWKNAFGEKQGLVTSGWFSHSRNPVYVGSWIGMLGWAIIGNSYQVTVLLILWAFTYLLAPFLEEPWLEQCYGEEYKVYKSKVPRFFWPFS